MSRPLNEKQWDEKNLDSARCAISIHVALTSFIKIKRSKSQKQGHSYNVKQIVCVSGLARAEMCVSDMESFEKQ